MRPEPKLSRHARGFGLVAALFLMIVVSVLVLTMARLAGTQHGSNSLSIQQARAYQATRAGLEWGITQAVNAGQCASGNPNMDDGGLAEFSVSVTCVSTSYDEGTVRIFRITARAENGTPGSRPDYAYRQLTAVVEMP